MSYADAFKVVGGGDKGWSKKAAKAKRLPKPEPFVACLRFVEFASGRKVIFKDAMGVRHFIKLALFEKMLTTFSEYRGFDAAGLWITRTWITEGRARLTRPVEGT